MPLYGCRPGCGACCIAASIASPIPGMPQGKPGGVRCIHLTSEYLCAIYEHPDRPPVCANLRFDPEMCGNSRDQALATLARWDRETTPTRS
jgi:Fe-S-cluster containining protein